MKFYWYNLLIFIIINIVLSLVNLKLFFLIVQFYLEVGLMINNVFEIKLKYNVNIIK